MKKLLFHPSGRPRHMAGRFAIPLLLSLAALVILISQASAQDISTEGWRLWPDREASWKDDSLLLPSEVNLATMPVHPPTGGWDMLNDNLGIPITLPSTVEEHYWGKFGTRPYTKNEAQKGAG